MFSHNINRHYVVKWNSSKQKVQLLNKNHLIQSQRCCHVPFSQIYYLL